MSDNTESHEEPQETPGFAPITSQEELDRIIGNRLAREREKYADYGELKEQAGKFAEAQETHKAELDAVQAELDEARNTIKGYEAAKEAAETRDRVAREFGIPATVLRGSTEEELTAHAEGLKELLSGPVVPTAHVKPEKKPDNEALSAVKQLFS